MTVLYQLTKLGVDNHLPTERVALARIIFAYAKYEELTVEEFKDLEQSSHKIYEEEQEHGHNTWVEHTKRMQEIYCIDLYCVIYFYTLADRTRIDLKKPQVVSQNDVKESVGWNKMIDFGFSDLTTCQMKNNGTIAIAWDESYIFPKSKDGEALLTRYHRNDIPIFGTICLYADGSIRKSDGIEITKNPFNPSTVEGWEKGIDKSLLWVKKKMDTFTELQFVVTPGGRNDVRGRHAAGIFGF